MVEFYRFLLDYTNMRLRSILMQIATAISVGKSHCGVPPLPPRPSQSEIPDAFKEEATGAFVEKGRWVSSGILPYPTKPPPWGYFVSFSPAFGGKSAAISVENGLGGIQPAPHRQLSL